VGKGETLICRIGLKILIKIKITKLKGKKGSEIIILNNYKINFLKKRNLFFLNKFFTFLKSIIL